MRIEITAELTARIERDEVAGCWEGYCPQLHVYSAANTKEDAAMALQSAVSMTVKGYWEQGVLVDEFKKRGFHPRPLCEDGFALARVESPVVGLPLSSDLPGDLDAISSSAATT